MPRLGDVARITSHSPPDDAPELVKNAWLIWTSVTNECLRSGLVPNSDGFYMYTGTLRGHITRLWPNMTEDEQTSFERSLYGFMKEVKAAKCIHKHSPTVWQIKATWDASMSRSVPVRFGFGHVPSRAEAKLTAHEAGEDLPPGEVTITRKEPAFDMTATTQATVPTAFQEKVQSRVDEMNARRQLAAEWLTTLSEPVAAEEVAHALGVNIHTTRNDLVALAERGVIHGRQETPEERSLRYGGTAYARRSTLYFATTPVPERVSRVVVDGFSHEPSVRIPSMSSTEIDRRLWSKLKRKGPRSRFTAAMLAEATGVQPEATRSRLRKMVKQHLIAVAGFKSGANEYRVLNLDGIREFLGQPDLDVLEQVTVAAPPAPASPPAVISEAPSMTVEEALARAVAVVAENTELRAENATLRAYAQELEDQVEQLTQPATPVVPTEAAEALSRWQPRSS